MSNDEEDVDAFLESIGMDARPLTREDEFMSELTEGRYNRIATLRYWLRHEMAKLQSMNESEKIFYYKDGINKENLLSEKRQVSKLEYAKAHIRYYLRMYHLPWFQDLGPGRGACDMNAIVDKIVAYGDMPDVINKRY